MAKYDKNTHGLRWQVPWGKHSPLSYRASHKAKQGMGLNELNFIAVMVLKDPYTWMQSLCRNSYTARWKHHKKHCPNLIPNDVDKEHHYVRDDNHEKDLQQNGIPISIDYNPNTSHYANMADAWNTWNGAYMDADFPRLIIRFEDLLLHAKAVITEICRCYGGTLVNETHTSNTLLPVLKSRNTATAVPPQDLWKPCYFIPIQLTELRVLQGKI
jgi:hypothetical protein